MRHGDFSLKKHEAKVKDAVKLFTLSYLTSAVWMPDVILDLAVLDVAILEFMLCI